MHDSASARSADWLRVAPCCSSRRRSASTSRRSPAAASTAKASTSAAASPPTSRMRRAAAVPLSRAAITWSTGAWMANAESRFCRSISPEAIFAMTPEIVHTCSARGRRATAHE